ncbi:hypothetical protein [Burkholderia vietnamiensis]|uniref:hypothetical protein n=1 Tax=Burkholderia vietnamiensis TaxID=60552 RepID=UPI001FC9FC15|nr:hypothetical protein [Burkholderia vietnamiensis]
MKVKHYRQSGFVGTPIQTQRDVLRVAGNFHVRDRQCRAGSGFGGQCGFQEFAEFRSVHDDAASISRWNEFWVRQTLG